MHRRRGIVNDQKLKAFANDPSKQQTVGDMISSVHKKMRFGHSTLTNSAKEAYRTFLAYYVPNSPGVEPAQILIDANEFATASGLVEMPSIGKHFASRLRLDNLDAKIE